MYLCERSEHLQADLNKVFYAKIQIVNWISNSTTSAFPAMQEKNEMQLFHSYFLHSIQY